MPIITIEKKRDMKKLKMQINAPLNNFIVFVFINIYNRGFIKRRNI